VGTNDPAAEDVMFGGQQKRGYHTSYLYDPLGDLTGVHQGGQTRTFGYDSLKRLTSATNPEIGTSPGVMIPVTYTYDSNGNLETKTDARGIITTFEYDALNRLKTKVYSDSTPAVTYTYDTLTNGKGRLASVSNSVSATSYSGYDAMGRPTGSTQTTDGVAYNFSYAYNLAGGLTTETYPSGRMVTTDYDSAGRTAGVKNSATALYYAGGASTDATNRIKYTAAGAISTMKLGNGLWEHAAFNTRLQPNEIGLGTSCSGTHGTASRTGHESVRQAFGGIGPV